ncbi:MAG TPA: LCP family protein [Streptosporangiaceae bacterium]|nr:LCP family protein [Streptosporangiaceae bacterium]
MPSREDPADLDNSAGPGSGAGQGPKRAARHKRRGLRVALVSAASLVVVLGAVVAGGYAFVNHLAGSVQRIPVAFTRQDVASRPTRGTTVLITGAGIGPTGGPVSSMATSGLIMLLHIDADQHAGGVVSIPPQTIVRVPGHGRTEIENALADGGPSLLVQTVENLTHVQIDHYARVDFVHVANVVDVLGGVNVILPDQTVSFGHIFHVGVNHLNGTTALDYVREPDLTQEGRVLRQQSLIRAILDKLANRHLLTSPVTMYHVLNALIGMLTVDSNFTNSELERLATELGGLHSRDGTFVTAPVHMVAGKVYLDRFISNKLWMAIRQDSIAAFAKEYPFTVTPVAPR